MTILEKIRNKQNLDYEEAKSLADNIFDLNYDSEHISKILIELNKPKFNQPTLSAFLNSLVERAEKNFEVDSSKMVDVCGTGGDKKNTINISTLNGFVLAGADILVAKHGNTKFSSNCGSSDILEYFGVKFSNKKEKALTSLEKTNFFYLHAPLFHPALKKIAPIRKKLKQKTIINLLGPLLNPFKPKYKIVGVNNLETMKLYSEVLDNDKYSIFNIVYSIDGYDEISLTSDFIISSNKYKSKTFNLNDIIRFFNTKYIKPEEIMGGRSIKENAKKFISVLKNENNSCKKVVAANASLIISDILKVSLIEAYDMAIKSIESKRAYKCFYKYLEINK